MSDDKKITIKMADGTGSEENINVNSIDDVAGIIKQRLGRTMLSKSDVQKIAEEDFKQRRYKQSKIKFGSRFNTRIGVGDSLSKEPKRLSDAELKELSLIDPYIGAIINTRVAQISSFGAISESKFDKGVRVIDLEEIRREDFETEEAFERELKLREAEKKAILEWVLKCGTQDRKVLDEMYEAADPTFKFCSLKDYFQAQSRSLLTFGRAARQNLLNSDGTICAFRPTPIETIKQVKFGSKVHVTAVSDIAQQSEADAAEYNRIPVNEKPIAYVQEVDGVQTGFFTEEDLKVVYYQVQSFLDLNGYPMGPIEFALFLVYIHQHTLSYLRNQFVKGQLSKSMIVVRPTDPSVKISDEDIESFKMEIQNLATRTDNSSVIPVIGGPVELELIKTTETPKDMEWMQVEQTVIRALCSAFQISPTEAGFGQLGDTAGMGQGSRDYELVQGEERGLRLLVDILMEDINDAVYANFPEAKKRYKVAAFGIGNETREGVLSRQVQELQTTATLNSLFSESDKNRQFEYGGDVPLAPMFHSNVAKYMTYGKFMESFFGEEGASKRPEFDFIIDPNLNKAYQELKMGMQQMQAQQQALGLEGQKMQLEAQQAQMQQMAQGGGQPGQEQAQQEQQPEEAQKSSGIELQKAWEESVKSNHESMLKSWLRIHDSKIDEE